jgi:hypothetical protein
MVNNVHHSVEAVSGENFALYIEGARCPFSYIQRTRGARGVASGLTCVIPAVEVAGQPDDTIFSPKDIPARAKVVLLWRNQFASSAFPRYVVLFEGEIANSGFIKTPDQKNYQFYAKHILSHLDGIAIMALEPNAYLEQVIEGKSAEGANLDMVITGSIIEKFKPSFVAGAVKKDTKNLDIYSFVRGAMAMYLSEGQKSVAKKAWPIQAAVQYGFLDRMMVKGADANIKWENIYYLIMQYTFSNMIPKIGGANITFLQLITMVAQMFLHDVDLMPDPPNYSSGIVVKPENVFNEPPTCNIIYPIMLTSMPFIEPWDSKPTRLIQITQPSTGISDAVLRQYLRTVSPPSLRKKFKEYTDASAVEKEKMDLTTAEEKIRGIITAYNEVPAFLSAAIEVVKDGTGVAKGESGKHPIENAASDVSGGEENSASINYTEGLLIDLSVYSAVFHKKTAHELLFNIEQNRDWKDSGGTKQAEYSKGSVKGANPGVPQMRPSRIYITPADWGWHTGDDTFNYVVNDGKVKVIRGRNFHIFEECTWAIPLGIKFNIDQDKIPSKNYNFIPLSKDKYADLATVNPLIDPAQGGSVVPQHAIDQKSVCGGTAFSIAIKMGNDEASKETTAQLVAAICFLTGLNPSTDVKGLYDEFSGRFPTASATSKEGVNSVYKSRVQDVVSKAGAYSSDMKQYAEKQWHKYSETQKDIKRVTDLAAKGKEPDPKTKTPDKKNVEKAASVSQNKPIMKDASAVTHATVVIDQSRAESSIKNPSDAARQMTNLNDYRKVAITNIMRGLAKVSTMTVASDDLKALSCYLVDLINTTQGKSNKAVFVKRFGTDFKTLAVFCNDISKATPTSKFDIATRNAVTALGCFVMAVAPELIVQQSVKAYLAFIKEAWKTSEHAQDVWNKIIAKYDSASEQVFELLRDFLRYYRYLYEEVNRDALIKANQGAGQTTLVDLLNYADSTPGKRPSAKNTKGTNDQKETQQTSQEDNTTANGAPQAPEQTDGNGVAKEGTTKVDEVKWKQLQEQYIEPICDYYFYKLRYESSLATIDMEFNPFIVPGYSCLLLDSDDKLAHPSHLRGFVVSVEDSITPESINTKVSMSHLRRADQNQYEEMLLTGTEGVTDTATGVVKPIEWGALDTVRKAAPFFGGEWAHTIDSTKGTWGLDTTYKNHLGSSLYEGSKTIDGLDSTYTGAPSYSKAMKAISRDIQHISFEGMSGGVKTTYDKLYAANPSLVSGQWNEGGFPSSIKMFTTGKSLDYFKDASKTDNSRLGAKTEVQWNSKVSNYINKLSRIVKLHKAT